MILVHKRVTLKVAAGIPGVGPAAVRCSELGAVASSFVQSTCFGKHNRAPTAAKPHIQPKNEACSFKMCKLLVVNISCRRFLWGMQSFVCMLQFFMAGRVHCWLCLFRDRVSVCAAVLGFVVRLLMVHVGTRRAMYTNRCCQPVVQH